MSALAKEVILWFFLGCMLVLIVMHAPGFAQATAAVGGQVDSMGNILTGSQVNNAVYSKQFTG
jgi:hypothetical protein